MNFLELANMRYSVRKYSDKPVAQADLDRILEAGRRAPTAINNQPQRILVVQSQEGLASLEKGANPYKAPLALIVCADMAESFRDPETGDDTYLIDAANVANYMMLEAASLGVGSVWVGQFDRYAVRGAFNIPEGFAVVCVLLMGYPATDGAPVVRTERKPLSETVFMESF